MLILLPLLQPPQRISYLFVEDLCKPTEMKRKVARILQIRVGPSWMDPIALFLKEDILLEEKSEIDKVQRKAPRF